MPPRLKSGKGEESKQDKGPMLLERVEGSSRSEEKQQEHLHGTFLSKLQGRMALIRQATQQGSAPASPAPQPSSSTPSPAMSTRRSSQPAPPQATQPLTSPSLCRNVPPPGHALSSVPVPPPLPLAAPHTCAASSRSPSPTAAAPLAAAAAADVSPRPSSPRQHPHTLSPPRSPAQPSHLEQPHLKQNRLQAFQSAATHQPDSPPHAPLPSSFTPTPSPSPSISSFKGDAMSSVSPFKARTKSSSSPSSPLSLLSAHERRRRRQDLLTAEALSTAQHGAASWRTLPPSSPPPVPAQQEKGAGGHPRPLRFYEDHQANSLTPHHHLHHDHHHQQQQQQQQHLQQPEAAAHPAAPCTRISPPCGIVQMRSGNSSDGSGDAYASASKRVCTSSPHLHSLHPHPSPHWVDRPLSPFPAPKPPPSPTDRNSPSRPEGSIPALPAGAQDSGLCSRGSLGFGAGEVVTPTPSSSSTPSSMAGDARRGYAGTPGRSGNAANRQGDAGWEVAGTADTPGGPSHAAQRHSDTGGRPGVKTEVATKTPAGSVSCSAGRASLIDASERGRRSSQPSTGGLKRRRPSGVSHRNEKPNSGSPPVGEASPLACSPAGTASTSSAPAVNPRVVLWVPPASPFSLLEEVLYEDPWKLMVACMLLNKTSSTQVRLILGRLFALYPTPESLAALYEPPTHPKPKTTAKKSTPEKATGRAAKRRAPSTAVAQQELPRAGESALPAPAAADVASSEGGVSVVQQPLHSTTPLAPAAAADAAFTPLSSCSPAPLAGRAANADIRRAAQQQVHQAVQEQVQQAAQQQVHQATQEQGQQAMQATEQGSTPASAARSSSPTPTTPTASPSLAPSYITSPANLRNMTSHPTSEKQQPRSSAAAAPAGAASDLAGPAAGAIVGPAGPAAAPAPAAADAVAGAVDAAAGAADAPAGSAAATASPAAGAATVAAADAGPCPGSHADALSQLQQLLRPLGLFRKRAVMLARFSFEYLHVPWTDPQELHGIGQYAADAYWMFCRGRWQQVDPADKDLRRYRDWLQQTGGEGAGLQRESLSEVLAAPAGASKTDHS